MARSRRPRPGQPPALPDGADRAADTGTAGGDGADLGPCPLCGRPMIAGPSVDRHHWSPRTQGGREATPLHRVCHRMIHRLFDDRTLARAYADPQRLRTHPEVARFVAWIRRQPPTYVDQPRRTAAERRRGRWGQGRRQRGTAD